MNSSIMLWVTMGAGPPAQRPVHIIAVLRGRCQRGSEVGGGLRRLHASCRDFPERRGRTGMIRKVAGAIRGVARDARRPPRAICRRQGKTRGLRRCVTAGKIPSPPLGACFGRGGVTQGSLRLALGCIPAPPPGVGDRAASLSRRAGTVLIMQPGRSSGAPGSRF